MMHILIHIRVQCDTITTGNTGPITIMEVCKHIPTTFIHLGAINPCLSVFN